MIQDHLVRRAVEALERIADALERAHPASPPGTAGPPGRVGFDAARNSDDFVVGPS